jgi:hypothetical protein
MFRKVGNQLLREAEYLYAEAPSILPCLIRHLFLAATNSQNLPIYPLLNLFWDFSRFLNYWRWNRQFPSKSGEPLPQRRSVTSHKMGILHYTAWKFQNCKKIFILMKSKRSDFIPTQGISLSCSANITLLSSTDDAGCLWRTNPRDFQQTSCKYRDILKEGWQNSLGCIWFLLPWISELLSSC